MTRNQRLRLGTKGSKLLLDKNCIYSVPFLLLAVVPAIQWHFLKRPGAQRHKNTTSPYAPSEGVSCRVSRAQHWVAPRRIAPLALGFTFLCLGVALSYFGFLWGDVQPNPGELLGSVLFWYGVIYLLLTFPFHKAFSGFLNHVRTPLGASVFAGYLAIHLFLYGFLLEVILASMFGNSYLAVSPAFFAATNVFSPPSITSAMLDLAYNPSIVLAIPPVFSAALSFYAISVALMIAVLVVTSVGETREISDLCTKGKKARSFVLLPALGVVFGASCCLSVAGLVSLVVPSAAELTSVLWVYFAIYFLLPSLAIVLLYLNLRSIEMISRSLRSAMGS